jgi:hypothetical protein
MPVWLSVQILRQTTFRSAATKVVVDIYVGTPLLWGESFDPALSFPWTAGRENGKRDPVRKLETLGNQADPHGRLSQEPRMDSIRR